MWRNSYYSDLVLEGRQKKKTKTKQLRYSLRSELSDRAQSHKL